jgi:hypothetical protein
MCLPVDAVYAPFIFRPLLSTQERFMGRQQFARASRTRVVQTAAASRPPTCIRSSLQRLAGAAVVLASLAIATVSCSRAVRPLLRPDEPPATIQQLWQEPASARDLFTGPGGSDGRPPEMTFEFVAQDTSGWSPGFDVRDRNGLQWSVKLGAEAQSEVVTSRILWAIGFHQPPTYYLDSWSLTGAQSGAQPAGRFRPELRGQKVVGEWSWYENPFVGSQEYGSLIVANLILNSWDWKTSNNKIYALDQPVNGVSQWYVVRDLGASLGKTTYPPLLKWFRLRGFGQGTRNDLEGFEQQGFIRRIQGDRVEFDYSGIYRDVIGTVTPAHVRWACARMSRLSDEQWSDAFRAGGYDENQTARYVARIKTKLRQGLDLTVG